MIKVPASTKKCQNSIGLMLGIRALSIQTLSPKPCQKGGRVAEPQNVLGVWDLGSAVPCTC